MSDPIPAVPKCGTSDQRNSEYERNYSPKAFYDSLIAKQPPLIVDVGAHRGESVLFFRHLYPDCTIHSFEPEPDNFAALQAIAITHGTFAHNMAVGDADETAWFYRQDISHLGGLLPINPDSGDSLGYARKAPNEKIEVRKVTLDSFCRDHAISAIDLLKIDVQGFEVGVLKGARETLNHTSCVMVEISLYDFYESKGSPLLQVEKLMHEAGFMLWDFSKISKNPRNFRTDWVEAVYKRSR